MKLFSYYFAVLRFINAKAVWAAPLGDAMITTVELPASGVVTELVAGMNYGIITTPDGLEVYFHRNSVLGGAFDRLETGSPVRFAAAPGLLGAQAVTVKLL